MIRLSSLITLLFLLVTLSQIQAQTLCDFHSIKEEKTPLGRTLNYKTISDSTYKLVYTFDELTRSLEEVFYCKNNPNITPRFESENDRYILLNMRCGYACRIALVLPADPQREVKEIEHWLNYDLEQNIVVSLGYTIEAKAILIKLFNLRTYEENVYDTNVTCDYGIPIDCFKDVEITENQIKIICEEGLKTAPFEIKLKN